MEMFRLKVMHYKVVGLIFYLLNLYFQLQFMYSFSVLKNYVLSVCTNSFSCESSRNSDSRGVWFGCGRRDGRVRLVQEILLL